MKKINNMTVFEPTDKCSLDEYSQKAAIEVPELIKKAKEEVNQKVIEISENDIKQDNEIATLKTNYTNLQEQNTKLESQIKKDRENMINLEVEGQSIHIEDSSDLEGKLEVLGNVEQDVREGYNLFNVKNISNKFITDNGAEQANEDWVLSDFIEVEEFTDYLLGWASTSPVFQARIILYNKDKSFMQVLNFFYENMYKKTFRTIQNCKYVRISYSTSVRGQEVKRKNVQLVKGTTEKPYEPYGASPSPEYPSEIRAVGDNINLLENTAKTQTVNGVTFIVNEDGTVVANGTATSLAQISLVANLKLSAGTYTIKDAKAYVESTEFNDWFDGLNNPSTLTFNTEVLLKNVYIQVKQGETVNNKIFYPKLEKGTVATSYSKFGQGSVEIRKQNENFFNKNNANILNAYIGASKGNIVSGTYHRTVYLKVNKGTYTITKHKGVPGFVLGYTKTEPKLGDIVENLVNAVGKTTETISVENGYLVINIYVTSDYNANYTVEDILNGLKIELGKVSTEYTEHQEQTKILPIQQPMLRIGNSRDIFIKKEGKWHERHFINKVIFNGTESWAYNKSSGNFAYRQIDNNTQHGKNNEILAISNYLKPSAFNNYSKKDDIVFAWSTEPYICIKATNSIAGAETTKVWVKKLYDSGNPLIIYRTLITPIDLPCTTEQAEVLDELDNFQTYKPVTNITTDSIAKLKLKYIADTKTYVDNKVGNLEPQVNVINQLLSTTKTSSVLLDNLQTDIESEVL